MPQQDGDWSHSIDRQTFLCATVCAENCSPHRSTCDAFSWRRQYKALTDALPGGDIWSATLELAQEGGRGRTARVTRHDHRPRRHRHLVARQRLQHFILPASGDAERRLRIKPELSMQVAPRCRNDCADWWIDAQYFPFPSRLRMRTLIQQNDSR